jgi:dienelactone hydrolase
MSRKPSTSVIRIPAPPGFLSGALSVPASARALIVLADAGVHDSYATSTAPIAATIGGRGYATLALTLLTPREVANDRASGRHHLDVALLTRRLGLVLDTLPNRPACRGRRVGLVVTGMAAAAGIAAATRHPEVEALVSWNGRADLAECDLHLLSCPILLLASADETHVVDLNRKVALAVPAVSRLEMVTTPIAGDVGRLAGARAARWFDSVMTARAIAVSRPSA